MRVVVGAQRPRAPHSAVQLLGLVLGTAAALHCVGNTYPKDGKCCSECPPGYGMESRCSGDQDTKCLQCASGFYNEAVNYEPCKPCTQCNQRSGSEPKQRCTPTQDTVCRCRPGTEPQDGYDRGVDCAPCPPGHFSPGDDQACKPWTKGGEEQRERETQNPKQAPGSQLSAQSPTQRSNSQTASSSPELKSDAQPTEPPRRPEDVIFKGPQSPPEEVGSRVGDEARCGGGTEREQSLARPPFWGGGSLHQCTCVTCICHPPFLPTSLPTDLTDCRF
uniref:TNFR-Cys domain-containing protein n=1 Tax=Felis catus TaxID=9685 RepID=A0ABI7Z927_FELCA